MQLRTPRVLLEPLRAGHVDLDHDAVMASRAQLRVWSQSAWPAEEFTRAENLADLERHEREHREGVAYTFTVLDPDTGRCLGCGYLGPPPVSSPVADAAGRSAHVTFWVRTSELAGDLETHLLAALREWLAREWRFDRVVFPVAAPDARRAALLAAGGLEPIGAFELPDGRRCLAFGEVPWKAARRQ